MMDQKTVNRVIHQKNKDLYKVDVFQLQNAIKEKENKEKNIETNNKNYDCQLCISGNCNFILRLFSLGKKNK